ncbi:acetyltransferase [Endothiovibrio diazotrophicus]
MNYDVFNGDADGLCALHQFRLVHPQEGELVTGVKRDINLVDRVDAGAGDRVTILDISFDKNREGVLRLLANGAEVRYFDHHFAGAIPDHPALETRIDPSPEVCTSLLVDAYLEGRQRVWAVTGAFGDNLYESARVAAEPLGLDPGRLDQLCELGTLLNYNGYGVELSDLYFHPADLYGHLRPYADPFAFIHEEAAFTILRDGFAADMEQAVSAPLELDEPCCALVMLPDTPWARRVSGVFGNQLARDNPSRAHALATRLEGGYRISVRAPLTTKSGADDLCRDFPTGGGRKGAAGINLLPDELYPRFVDRFREVFAL